MSRVSLVDRLQQDHNNIGSEAETAFVKGDNIAHETATSREPPRQEVTTTVSPRAKTVRRSKQSAAITPGLIPVNVRIRPDVARALKTASLDRQMRGVDPHSKREIVEEALEPWLRSEGYLTD